MARSTRHTGGGRPASCRLTGALYRRSTGQGRGRPGRLCTELYLTEEEVTEEVQADQPDDFLEYSTELYLAEEELTEEVQADQPDDFLEYSTDDIV
ncbi:hypothetical protein AAC387_Pa07g1976 [Persea americana]